MNLTSHAIQFGNTDRIWSRDIVHPQREATRARAAHNFGINVTAVKFHSSRCAKRATVTRRAINSGVARCGVFSDIVSSSAAKKKTQDSFHSTNT